MSQRLLKSNTNNSRRRSTRRHTEALRHFNSSDPVQLKAMTKEFGDFRAVDELTLSVKKNEIIALLGHNGAGKTTAIYMLTGMLMPTGGDAIINGFSIRRETDMVRRSIGLCQQHDVLFEKITVEEHLRLAMRIRMSRIDK
jgi:ABC-type multidrug transport system ATPase subunit|mmetsp:Transcript_16267/g.22013  ORF Transcript_16267/g.22013 Transcript_16267/m.22013 type:complete len:141 (+) Transcript_16267:1014-1436(+)